MANPRRTQAQWQAIIDSYDASGLSGIDFCRREGIHPKSFYRAKSTYSSTSSPKPFIQATPRSTSSSEIALILPSCRIQCSSQVSPQWLAQLVNLDLSGAYAPLTVYTGRMSFVDAKSLCMDLYGA